MQTAIKIFKNRKDAGMQLGAFLKTEFAREHPLILGIPRGGVEIAYYVARTLETDFTVVVAKKLGYPGQEELAFGAMAEDGSVYITPFGKLNLNEKAIEEVVARQWKEIERRTGEYRQGQGLPSFKNRTVIIVDDGIATGATFVPTINLCKKKGAAKVVVAAPVSPSSSLDLLKEADEIRVIEQPDPFYAVGQFYEDFAEVSDQEVLDFLHAS